MDQGLVKTREGGWIRDWVKLGRRGGVDQGLGKTQGDRGRSGIG